MLRNGTISINPAKESFDRGSPPNRSILPPFEASGRNVAVTFIFWAACLHVLNSINSSSSNSNYFRMIPPRVDAPPPLD